MPKLKFVRFCIKKKYSGFQPSGQRSDDPATLEPPQAPGQSARLRAQTGAQGARQWLLQPIQPPPPLSPFRTYTPSLAQEVRGLRPCLGTLHIRVPTHPTRHPVSCTPEACPAPLACNRASTVVVLRVLTPQQPLPAPTPSKADLGHSPGARLAISGPREL